MIDELDGLAAHRYVSRGYRALIYAGLGETEQAITALQQAFAEGPEWLVYLDLDSRYAPLRGDRRFQDLVARAGLSREGQTSR